MLSVRTFSGIMSGFQGDSKNWQLAVEQNVLRIIPNTARLIDRIHHLD